MAKRSLPVTRLAMIFAVAAIAIAVLVLWRTRFVGRSFDAADWQADATVGSGIRQAMADRLLARHMLIGKTRAEVINLLGTPPPTGYFAQWDFVYWLGPERGFISIDSEWLVIRLKVGRVVEARLVTD